MNIIFYNMVSLKGHFVVYGDLEKTALFCLWGSWKFAKFHAPSPFLNGITLIPIEVIFFIIILDEY